MSVRSLFSSTYAYAPIWLQNAAVSAAGWQLERQRYGHDFNAILVASLEQSFASIDELRTYQQQEWEQRIQPILEQLPAYKSMDCSFANIQNFPVLSKPEVRDNLDDYRNPQWSTLNPIQAHTSGTTGAGLKFLTTSYSLQRQFAYWWRYRIWHGIERSEWCGVFGGREVVPTQQKKPPYWRINSAGRLVMFSQYHLSPERGVQYIREIKDRGLRWVHGYPSVLAMLAKIGIDAGLEGTTDVQWVTLGGENLLAHQQTLIQRMFNATPLQHYGLAEGVANISLCPEGKLHVDEDFSLVEFLPLGNRDEGHRLIGTTLDNQAMPLVRYDTGDIVLLAPDEETCTCGRPGRIVLDIDGRKEDFLMLSDETMIGRIDHLFKDAVNIVEAQVIQQVKGAATYRIVRGPAYSDTDEKNLRKESFDRFGDRLTIQFEYLEEIPKTTRGKLRLVINEIKQAQIDG
jgi:phenylacetate-CoA ligase